MKHLSGQAETQGFAHLFGKYFGTLGFMLDRSQNCQGFLSEVADLISST